jgi:hypothetical protein
MISNHGAPPALPPRDDAEMSSSSNSSSPKNYSRRENESKIKEDSIPQILLS